MAKRRRSSRARTIFRKARRSYSRGKSFLGGRGKGGGIMQKTWGAFKEGTAYGVLAQRFAPQVAPLAQLYGEYRGGGFEGLLVTELIVNNLLGRPSALAGLGLNLNLGGLLGGGGSGSGMGTMGAAV